MHTEINLKCFHSGVAYSRCHTFQVLILVQYEMLQLCFLSCLVPLLSNNHKMQQLFCIFVYFRTLSHVMSHCDARNAKIYFQFIMQITKKPNETQLFNLCSLKLHWFSFQNMAKVKLYLYLYFWLLCNLLGTNSGELVIYMSQLPPQNIFSHADCNP